MTRLFRMLKLLGLGLLFMAGVGVGAQAAEKVRLTSLEWPPYSGDSLPEKGASIAVAKAAFAAMGYELEVKFFPWSRAVAMAKSAPGYVGYLPEYYSVDVGKEFLFSDPIGSGPLGLAEPVAAPVSWSSVPDLSKYRVGVVQDYVNTDEFDKLVAAKKIKADTATDDKTNLLKLAGGRLDVAVIDRNVMNYLLAKTPELAAAKAKVKFNGKLLEDKKLYVCFRKTPEGTAMAKVFNDGLKKINVDAIVKKYLKP